jgi:hypothetical protein
LVFLLGMAGSASAWTNVDVGTPTPGSASYDEDTATWTVTGNGNDIWDNADNFHYVYKYLKGDGEIIARVASLGPGSNLWAKAGVMIRDTLDAGSSNAFVAITGGAGDGANFQWRTNADGGSSSSRTLAGIAPPASVKLVRQGDTFTGYIFLDDEWQQEGQSATVAMTDPVYIGLAITSHVDGELRTATFDNVSFIGDIYDVKLTALNPDPADGAENVATPLVKWTAGSTAAFHDVYFGTNPTPGPAEFRGRQPLAMCWHAPDLAPNTTYYWRIDEVEANGVTIRTGDVWSFTSAPLTAYNPDPADGAIWVDADADLSWSAGMNAITHDIYFGTNEADVAAGTGGAFKANQPATTYDPGTLSGGTTYYWRIDEVEGDGVTINKGDVWSFTTYAIENVEDFETGDFGKFPWEHAGDTGWSTTSQERHSGLYSARSGPIRDGERSSLQVTLECVMGNITFYRKVSSESRYDHLKFYINGVEQDKWSGEEDWAEVSFPVMEGARTFEWTYSKDGSSSQGEDTAWIDDIVFPSRVQSVESSLVYEGIDGHLVYRTYANEGQTNSVNIIPDFSHCGYMGGGVAIPDVPVVTTLSPQDGDDTQMIQDAIDHVSSLSPDANGFRGAVLLTAGRYQVSSTLTIRAGGVVLRGQGQDVLGTVLEATGAYGYRVINVKGSGEFSEQSETIRFIISPYVPVGTYSFNVSNISGYSVGDWIIIQRTPNKLWIDELAMGQYGWRVDSYCHMYERYVVDITGNTITIDSPMVEVIEFKYGGGRIFKSRPLYRPKQCGVENLRIESTYASDTDESHPWEAVVLQDVEDCWVRRVTAQYFAGSCVNVASESTRVTIEDCAFLDPKSLITGGRRGSFAINPKGNHILFQRCYAAYARHSYMTGHLIPGPNVFVDCYAYNCWLDSGPHHRWATGTLYDNIRDSRQINSQNHGPSGTGQGWAGAQQVLWNCQSGTTVCEAPKGAMNFAIGCSCTRKNGQWVDEPDGWWEHHGQPVKPRSLYYKQLEDRLGMAAVENVTMPEQRSGGIWPDLADWAGEYTFQRRPIDSDTPADERLEIGSYAIFEVVPVPRATILEYQWYELSGSSYIPIGNNAATLTILNMQAEDKGREFFCRVITDKGPFYSRNAAICHVDYNLRLVEDFEAMSGSPDDKAATGVSGGRWDTHGERTSNIGVITKNYSHVLQYMSHSSGGSRGVMVSGLSNPINYLGITDLNLNTDSDAMDGNACHKENVVAGLGVLSAGSSADIGLIDMDVVTTDETATVLARLVHKQWYNVWIVADNTNDTYDLYLSETEGPGTPIPDRPLAKDLIGEGLAFGKRTARSLYGAMFFTETTTRGTKPANIDDIYWSAP